MKNSSSGGERKSIEIAMPVASGMSGADSKKLKQLCKKVPEIDHYVKDLVERMEKAEDKLDMTDISIKDIINSLKQKAEKSEIADVSSIKASIKDINRQLKQFETVKSDIDVLKKRSHSLEKQSVSLEGRIDYINKAINARLRELENLLVALKEELEKLDSEYNRQGGVIIQVTQRIDTLEIKFDNMDKMMSGNMLGDSIGSPTQNYEMNELKKSLAQLKRDFLTFKEEQYKQYKEFDEEVDKKVDKSDLVEYERVMRERMEALEKALQKTKSELKKAMRILDDRIKRVGDQVQSRGPSLERDEAMLSRKPIDGLQCASCDKNLTNMIGLPAEHHTWKRMPRKENERIPMIGQGFSRMLMTLNHQNSVNSIAEDSNSKTFYTPRPEDNDDSLSQSCNKKLRNSISRLEKDGSTTVDGSVLPQIKKGKKGGMK